MSNVSDQQYNLALSIMEQRFANGALQEKYLLEAIQKMVIVDRLVPPRSMDFIVQQGGSIVLSYANPDGSLKIVTLHRHAYNQLCAKVQFPMPFANRLDVPAPDGEDEEWKRRLLVYNLNSLFHLPEWKDPSGAPVRFLHRLVNGELRGFLSRRFNRHIASAPLVRAFVETARREGAKPIDAIQSPVRFTLKFLLPQVYEAFPGEHVCLGVEWGNSDFGSGKHTVSQTLWRVHSSAGVVLDDAISRVHLGSVIEDSDIEMSDDTAKKEVEAQKSAINDAVVHLLSQKTIERILTALKEARDQKIPWAQLRGQLGQFLGKADIDWLKHTLDSKGAQIIDLPPVSFDPDGTPVANAYWASSAVSLLASRADNPDRKLELQHEAGKLLEKVIKSE